MNKQSISVVLITKNAERTLEQCLSSIQSLASEIVIVDDFSNDQTREIAKKFGAKILTQTLQGFGAQKQFALTQASSPWIFLIDSDEQASPELPAEIQNILSGNSVFSAYKIKRKNFYFGQWLKHGGKYPDYQVRLLKKSACHFSQDIVHEKIVTEGSIGTLQNPLIHHSYPDLKTWFEKLDMFSDFRGQELWLKGVRPSWLNLLRFCVFRPLWRFDRRFFLKLGFLDGIPGLLACIHDSLTEILGYWILCQKSKSKA